MAKGNGSRLDDTAGMVQSAEWSRRQALIGGVSVAALGILGLPGRALAGEFTGKKIVFASWGGAYQDAEKVCYCDPFVAKTGAVVLQDGPVDYAKFRTMVENGKPDWTVVDQTIDFLYSGVKSNLFEKLDLSKIHTDRIPKAYVHDYGIGCISWSYNIGFNTKTFPKGKHPQSWAEVFDLKKFPGTRTLRDRVAPMLEIALMADGVPIDHLYTVLATDKGVDRAFAKLDTIKPHVNWWATNSQSQQLLVDGECSCGVILNGRVYDAATKGGAIDLDWNQNIQSVDYLVIPRGATNLDVAHGLIDEMTLAENQGKLANMIAYSPTNPAAFAHIDPKISPWLSTNPENAAKGFVIDAGFWETRLQKLSERWEDWKLS